MAHILVIEDNQANLDLMTYLLSAFGHTPLAAHDGQEGWEVAQREALDVILCDVQLPKLDGFELARLFKRHPTLGATPLVAVTALAMVGDRDRMLASGFDGYISKPIVPETFVSQVEGFLDPASRSSFAPTQSTAAPAEVAAPAASHATILVVDDTPANRDLMRSMLEPFGYTVIVAPSVREGIALAQQHTPELVVSDLHMPGRDGFDLIRSIKADPRLRRIMIIMHSATVMSDLDRRKALEIGADRFIKQPVEPQLVLDIIAECLRERQERLSDEA